MKMSKLWVVGMGPGELSGMTIECREVLERVDVIVGYKVYVELLQESFPDKEYISSGMRREEERARLALEAAAAGREVGLVSSGDAGIYGLASLSLELAPEFPGVEVEIIAGVTAALAGAARLGAPMGHDSCLISLSDLLTPWSLIEKRLAAAANGDFVTVLYNPKSKKRRDYPDRAVKILIEAGKSPDTACGLVRNIGRAGEEVAFCSLEDLPKQEIDMFTTIFIGNSQTRMVGRYLVTPRGFLNE